jgi:cytoskeletal protein CcmA (bactofilin family)
MFSNKNKDTVPAPASAAQPMAPRRSPRVSAAPSIISADVTIIGSLTSTGDIQIDGRIEGDLRSAGLVIGEKAEIHGEILAEDITIRGLVRGRIRARKVLLCATARVEGDILHEALVVEAGAFFEGNCRHSDNPLGDEDAPKPTIVSKPVMEARPSAAPSAMSAILTTPMPSIAAAGN